MNNIKLQLELMYLEQLAIKRDAKLDRIALSEMMRMDRNCDLIPSSEDIVALQKDNILTDAQIRWHFLYNIPPEVTELHLKRCNDSGVEYCTCLPNRTTTGQEVF